MKPPRFSTKRPEQPEPACPKPCPFCGTKPVKGRKGLDERFGYADEVTYCCPGCGCSRSARGDVSKPGYADNSTVERRALEAWNCRYGDTQ